MAVVKVLMYHVLFMNNISTFTLLCCVFFFFPWWGCEIAHLSFSWGGVGAGWWWGGLSVLCRTMVAVGVLFFLS